ncbi:hypothetical protein D3Z45_22220 [Lachnospiraceae bacterium]|nr:hypothetical protein [Lachnospiraceae bacterium]
MSLSKKYLYGCISPISYRGRTGQASPVSGRLGNRGAGVWQGRQSTARTYYERAEAALTDRGAIILKIWRILRNEH